MQSRTIRANVSASSFSSASRPFDAVVTVWPICLRLRLSIMRLIRSSSTASTCPMWSAIRLDLGSFSGEGLARARLFRQEVVELLGRGVQRRGLAVRLELATERGEREGAHVRAV